MQPARLRLAADAGFWPGAARAVVDFAARLVLPPRELGSIVWLVPAGVHARLARASLHEALGRSAFAPPRIVPIDVWLGLPTTPGVAVQAELFVALRANRWVREAFGAQPANLWALAREISLLADELTWASFGAPEAFDQRLQASLARHFRQRAARALEPQAQLVLQLWRARRSAGDGAVRALRELAARAAAAETPLVHISAARDDDAAWEAAFLQSYAQRAPVLAIAPDVGASVRQRPLLAAAWPELAGERTDVAIATRAEALRDRVDTPSLPAIVAAASLEEDAMAVAGHVLDWLRAGCASVALVALDRLTARRVRALLERAQISVRDETGWKLSTTSAAAAVMRWYDLVADDLYWRDLLDWLKSSFTLADRPGRLAEAHCLERAIRAAGAVQGARAMRRALDEFDASDDDGAAADAMTLLTLIDTEANAMRRAVPTLAAQVDALRHALDALGMRAALTADPVGRAVLREIDALGAEVAEIGGRVTLADFRALLSSRFEEVAFVDREVESPVVMISLAASALRSFDAAVLIGADAQHLPALPAERLFMSNAVRGELGLATAEQALREQALQLAALLSTVPRVVATWRTRLGDEPNALSPLLERLQFVTSRALDDDLLRAPSAQAMEFEVDPEPAERPQPRAAVLLPDRVTASQVQSLVNCAYQFYARRLLGLAELDDIIEMPDKRDFGDALHEVLRRFHRDWGSIDFRTVDRTTLEASLAAQSQAVFGARTEGAPGLLAFQRRFDGLIGGYVDWLLEASGEGWRWRAAEEAISASVALRDGREIELAGRVDRIDGNDAGRVRVLDYKAKATDDLRKGLKVAGEDVQLPFYGLLLATRGVDLAVLDAAYLAFSRAFEGEGGVASVAPKQPFDALVRAVGTRLAGDLQRIADGAPLPAIGVESVCAYCEMRGLCRRDDWVDSEGSLP